MGKEISGFICFGFEASQEENELCQEIYYGSYQKNNLIRIVPYGYDEVETNYIICFKETLIITDPSTVLQFDTNLSDNKIHHIKQDLLNFCIQNDLKYKEPKWLLGVEYCV
jgi:hypothetical protein